MVKKESELCVITINERTYVIKAEESGRIIYRQEIDKKGYNKELPLFAICECKHDRIFNSLCILCN